MPGAGGDSPGAGGTSSASGGQTGSDGGPPDDGGSGMPSHEFKIEFDYRFDTVDWFTDDKRSGLAAAARLWADRIADDFEEIPAGVEIRIRNLEQVDDTYMDFPTDAPIDDVLVFVACSEVLDGIGVSGRTRRAAVFPGTLGAEFQNRLSERWSGVDQEPWAVGIAFACNEDFFFDPTPDTSDDVPAGSVDFITVAAHELGHALGIGPSQTFIALKSADETQFLGMSASDFYGGPVPLDPDAYHLSSDLMVDGEPVLMDISFARGRRTFPTELDFAVLEDLGYEVLP